VRESGILQRGSNEFCTVLLLLLDKNPKIRIIH
jgi:hypothetical protein